MLDTNGTLKTAITFDYESNASSYTVTVQAKDDENASIESNTRSSFWMSMSHPARIILSIRSTVGMEMIWLELGLYHG